MNLVLVRNANGELVRSDQRSARARKPRQNWVTTREPEPQTGIAYAAFSWVANRFSDKTLNRALAITGVGAAIAVGNLFTTISSTQTIAPATPNYRQVTPTPTFAASIPSLSMGRTNAAPIAPAPIAAATIETTAPIPTTSSPAFDDGILYLTVRDNYIPPSLNRPDQIRAMKYILQNEGCREDAYTCSMGKVTISGGVNISANPALFAEVLDCDLTTAKKIGNGAIDNIQLSPEANGALFAAKFAEIQTIVINKCANGGVDFNTQPPRVKLALMDSCYVRPAWLDDEAVRMMRVGNYAELGDKFARMSNNLATDRRQTGTAKRLAKAAILCHNATQNRGIPTKLSTTNLNKWEIDSDAVLPLAVIGINPAAVPHRARENATR